MTDKKDGLARGLASLLSSIGQPVASDDRAMRMPSDSQRKAAAIHLLTQAMADVQSGKTESIIVIGVGQTSSFEGSAARTEHLAQLVGYIEATKMRLVDSLLDRAEGPSSCDMCEPADGDDQAG